MSDIRRFPGLKGPNISAQGRAPRRSRKRRPGLGADEETSPERAKHTPWDALSGRGMHRERGPRAALRSALGWHVGAFQAGKSRGEGEIAPRAALRSALGWHVGAFQAGECHLPWAGI
jgi:hypothetical protein